MNVLSKNTVKIFSTSMIALSLLFTSCSNDDDKFKEKTEISPVINSFEIGRGNNHTAIIGSDLHLEAHIGAENKIGAVQLEIHKEEGSGWEFIEIYNEFSGNLNAVFHKHIDVPSTAEPGIYNLYFKVIDQLGNIIEKKEELELKVAGEISISITELGTGTVGNSHAQVGSDMSVGGTIISLYPIATIQVEIHNESNSSAPKIESEYTNYVGQTTVNFREQINIPSSQPVGDYHFHFTVTDVQGNSKTEEYEIEIE